MRFGKHLGVADELKQVRDPRIHCPTLYVEHAVSSVTLKEYWERTGKFADDCKSVRVATPGYWVQFEAREEVNALLEQHLAGAEDTEARSSIS